MVLLKQNSSLRRTLRYTNDEAVGTQDAGFLALEQRLFRCGYTRNAASYQTQHQDFDHSQSAMDFGELETGMWMEANHTNARCSAGWENRALDR